MSASHLDRPARVLLVEDNAGDVLLTREALETAEHAVELSIVGDGEAALAYLRREGEHADATRPDLVISDLNLPRMNGTEILEAMRADASLRRIPVVVLTTSNAQRDIVACYERGANSYVVKPFDLDEYTRAVAGINTYWLGVSRLPE